jgi:oxygen-dependent protoporphyrinogen oxidase
VTGLAAALRLRERLPSAKIIMYEGSPRLGGKLRTGRLAGGPAETGAEAFLMRDPAGGDSAAASLVRRLGLAGELLHPEPVPPALFVGGGLRPMPGRTLLGVPSDLSTLDGVAPAAAERDRDAGRPLLAPDEDVAVGALVRERLGDEVVDRLVDPLLGGVYAGRADDLSLEATMPALARECRAQSTLVGAARAAVASSRAHQGGPVFGTLRSGLSTLVDAMAAALGPVELRLGAPVRELRPVPAGWRLVSGPVPAPVTDEVDAVVLAVPGRPAARLLGAGPELEYASVALVTLALPETAELPELSGFLVPANEGYAVKAATFFTRKWAHHRRPDGTLLVRLSLGRYGDAEVLRRPDEELVALVRAELGELLGQRLPEPAEASVSRWGGALPQYPPGHPARVAALRAGLPETIAVAGAAYDGVGIPACIGSGERAADRVAERLLGATAWKNS